ncbi:MAG: DUF1573 domain-containing protein [Candidatus Wildermuthbacteria bacterium]|nr:DUF1573 domain-containing protein [Candidatus Wildermuthbacteria bacterium]
MKLKIILILVFIAGLAFLGYTKAIPGADENGGGRPQIEISPATFDFGDIQYGDIVEYDFVVKNTGNEILEIKRVATSCSCTTAKISKEIINPEENANIHVRYDSGAMGLAHGKGKQERIIYVKSNDPVTPQAESMIYANVK